MTSFSGLGIGLSLVFCCLLLALAAELYYLLWWKKRATRTEIEDDYSNYGKELVHLFCWKTPSPLNPTQGNSNNSNNRGLVKDPDATALESDPELGSSKDFLLKSIGEESVEAELMRLHNLAGPPRFLFTIKEETKEDLESDDGKSKDGRSRKGSRTGSLSDLVLTVDTPFVSPLASPPMKCPLDSYYSHEFNPLFESSTDAEVNGLKASPPPKFKFLRDAEEKLLKRLMEEAEKRVNKPADQPQQHSGVKASKNSTVVVEEKEGSFLKFIVGKNIQPLHYLPQQFPSSSSQVLPLASSPTTLRPVEKDTVH